MDDATDLTEDQRGTLSSLLDEIVPPRPDGLPGAGALAIAEYVERALRSMHELRAMISEGLIDLERQAQHRFARPFPQLDRPDKLTLINEQGFIFPLMFQTYAGYYHHPRVVEALGVPPRPPHPEGYAMGEDDLSLLDPVRQRGPLYRKV